MLSKDFGAALQGIDAIAVTIEASVTSGVGFTIVGLPDTAVKERDERVTASRQESGYRVPRRGVGVLLSPAALARPRGPAAAALRSTLRRILL